MRNRKTIILTCITMVLLLGLTGCGTSSKNGGKPQGSDPKTEQKKGESQVDNGVYPQLTNEVSENERLVEMETSMGSIKIKLFPEYAPKAVENFITHSEQGYYDGLLFHRVIKDFMIQGGDPKGNGTGGESIWGKPFEDEFAPNLFNVRGALSMANAGANTNGSQFFIVQSTKLDPSMKEQMKKAGYPDDVVNAYDQNGGTPWLDGRHTVFGQVIEGMDVIDAIVSTPVDAKDKPQNDVTIKGIKVLK